MGKGNTDVEHILHIAELTGLILGLLTLTIVGVIHCIGYIKYVWSRR